MCEYECYRCGYKTTHKACIRKHLYINVKICPALSKERNITLTDEIKDYILNNRIYHPPEIEIIKEKNKIITLPKNDYLHYIYLIRCKENVRHNENIYKIGKTVTKELTINLKRLTSYGIGTELLFIRQCKNSDIIEKNILKEFNKKFTKYELGNEYFIGNYNNMIDIISEFISKEYKEYEVFEEFIKQTNKNNEINENLLVIRDIPEITDNFIKLKIINDIVKEINK
jgi:hypothetical protein